MRVYCLVPLAFVGCGLFGSDAPTPSPAPDVVPPAPTADAVDAVDTALFASACDGAGPSGPVQRDPVAGGAELVEISCEWFAYQGTYELWLQPAEGEPVHQLNRLGVGSLDEATGQWTNLEKARGPGDCGVFERFAITDSAITVLETREQSCSNGDEAPNIDPNTWPLVNPSDGCEGAKDYFRCEVASGKVVQLCGAEDGSWMTYQFGPAGAPELVYPPDRSPSQFNGGQQMWARAQADFIAFNNADHQYILVDKIGGAPMHEGEVNNFTGVVVKKDGQEVARLGCSNDPQTTGFAALAGQLQAIGYND